MNAAKKKISFAHVDFVVADITKPWSFVKRNVDLVTCSLILEHIESIDVVFQQANRHLDKGGLFYIGELHPFKQYAGSKARFENNSELFILECYTHHMSDYLEAGNKNGFTCLSLTERFDDENTKTIPRIISFLFQKT